MGTKTANQKPAEAAVPYPQPTSNPPGGGSWTWDTQNGKWVEKNQPKKTEQE